MLKNKTICITGGAGFIASHLIDAISQDNKIILYDLFSRNAFQYVNAERKENVVVIRGDVLDAELLTKSMAGCDTVIHCAAVAGIYSVIRNATMTMKINFLGTYNALEAAVKNNVKHFVNFSTSEVYGPHVYDGKEEDITTQGPMSEKRWIYAVSKLAAEHFSHTYEMEYGLKVATVRPFNIYGPRQVGEGAIREMILRALKGDTLTVYNDGTQIRSWCYVSDFIDAVTSILEHEKAWGEVFNVGSPKETISVLNLARTIIRLAGSSSKIEFKKHPGPEVYLRVPNIGKARRILGYEPRVELEAGIGQTIEFYRQHLAIA
ncbi:MAG: NAD-dependent epimerase/dehydratase family protein [Candidatus Omnitrophica bacterium]|nr:NAD-dependent epimerase/dehydratase family protein [Candidatus Omnitrophota bacterium]